MLTLLVLAVAGGGVTGTRQDGKKCCETTTGDVNETRK